LLVVVLTGAPWWSAPIAAVVTAGLIFWLDASGNPWGKGLEPLWWVWAAVVAMVFLGGWWRGFERRRLVDKTKSLDELRAMHWREFELLVGEAYRRQGWQVTERGGGGADGGVDLELRRDGELLLVQCKRWRERLVKVDKVRELWGVVSHERATGAIFVTSGRFTADAEAFAHGKRYELADGDRLLALVDKVRYRPQPRPDALQRRDSSLLVSASPPNPQEGAVIAMQVDSTSSSCPRCGSPMVRRPGVDGRPDFWGCSRFPE
jgi:restriction system protein